MIVDRQTYEEAIDDIVSNAKSGKAIKKLRDKFTEEPAYLPPPVIPPADGPYGRPFGEPAIETQK